MSTYLTIKNYFHELIIDTLRLKAFIMKVRAGKTKTEYADDGAGEIIRLYG
jgi:hypothetical protein